MPVGLDRRVRLLPSCCLSLTFVLACATPFTSPVADSSVTIQTTRIDLGTLGGVSSFANDINVAGMVVGSAENGAGVRRAFRWTADAGMTDLGTLPGDDWSEACCITDDGRILGVSGSTRVSTRYGTPVIWSADGTIAALGIPLLPGAQFAVPSGFNQRGDVVGWDVVSQQAWIWSETRGKHEITAGLPGGALEGAAPDVSDAALVAGTTRSTTAPCAQRVLCWRPFLWSDETGYRELSTPDDDSTAVATAIGLSDGPTIVGWAMTDALGMRPYVWRDGEGFTILPTAAGGYAMAINRSGTAVGAAWDTETGTYQATAWPRSAPAVRLSPDDSNPQIAFAINDMGIIAGWSAQEGGGHHATVWVPGRVSQSGAPAASIARVPGRSLPLQGDPR